MATGFIGEIRIYAFGFAPRFWAQCNGQSLPIAQNQALFSILGTTYGGNGVTTFNLPDLRSRTPFHTGTNFSLGQVGGSENVTLISNQMPQHNHLMNANSGLKISIEGHTDSTGSADHNRQLSTARARSVLGALVGLGIDPARLSSKGFGPDKPVASNTSEEGRAANRRVELVKQ